VVSIRKVKNILFIIAGFLSLGLGILGIVLPVIPTTPLLLLASFCFVKGSTKFEIWFKGTDLYKKHVENFLRHQSMTLKQKIVLNIFADTMIIIAFINVNLVYVRVLLVFIIIYKYYYFIAKIKTVRSDQWKERA
jgi:uncharacterized protein